MDLDQRVPLERNPSIRGWRRRSMFINLHANTNLMSCNTQLEHFLVSFGLISSNPLEKVAHAGKETSIPSSVTHYNWIESSEQVL